MNDITIEKTMEETIWIAERISAKTVALCKNIKCSVHAHTENNWNWFNFYHFQFEYPINNKQKGNSHIGIGRLQLVNRWILYRRVC